nr:immunoglobulin light chain junction region [Macaca mulatta]MOV34600.1 immunoglobulin light chain junction region [Macaca mulatta]MOV34746.1 immunoglobulin light chain junction region [Macaca mulatta]MOV35009.1 immunoglobulin light chain junction region [Macaca mulatta]MOV35504.1 immunoglobulin light chain junction region [Macaca mulatta]
CMQGTQLPLTF